MDEHPVDAGNCGAAPGPQRGSEASPADASPVASPGKESPLEVSPVEPTPAVSPGKEAPAELKTEESTDIGAADETPPEDPSEDFYPDGGTTAWLQVVATHLMSCLAWGYAATFGVYQTHYTETMALPRSQISWIGSIQIFLTFAMCTVSGRLSDAGFNHATVAGGCALAVFGTFMTSLATAYWQILLAQGICTGVGLGLLFMPGIAIVSSYFKRRRAFALAVAATGTGTGSVSFPACVQYLIPKVGFPWAVRCAAFVALAVSALALALLRPRLKPRRTGPLVEWEAFREAPYILFTLGLFIWFWAHYFGFFYIQVYTREELGFSPTQSVELLLIVNALGVPARPFVGYVADNVLGPITTLMAGLCVLSVMFFSWIGVGSSTGIYVWCSFFGLSAGGAQGVFGGALSSLTKDPTKMGTRFGMVSTLLGFAALAGPPTAGAIIDRSRGSYTGAQVWAGTAVAVAAATVGACRTAITGRKWRVKV